MSSAKLPIVPDLSNFHKRLRVQLRADPAQAPVTIVPNFDKFRPDLERGLGRFRASISVGVRPDFSGFNRELRSYTAAHTGHGVELPVDLDLTRARAQLAAFRAEASRNVRVRVDVDTGRAMAQIAAVRAAAAGIGRRTPNLNIGGAGGGSSIAGGFGPIPAAAGAAKAALVGLAAVNLVPLVGQLAKAAGVISLIPAAAAAAASSLATVVIGSSGIGDAFSAGAKAAESAATDAAAASKAQAAAQKQVESAARGVTSAQAGVVRAERGVADAQKASERAQESLTQARKDAAEQIEDLNLALKGSALDERDAELSLRRAQQRLAELGKDGQPVTALDFEEAVLGVDQAKQRIDEVRERNADLRTQTDAANKAGVDGSAQVVQAQEAVADADLKVADARQSVLDSQQAVIEAQTALTDAQTAAATATTGAATAADKYAEALANLSPNARDFVTQTRDLGDAWRDLRLVVQDNLFDGLGDSITDLAGRYFPVLTDGLGGIATEINGGLRRALEDLSSESSALDWTKIFENTKQAIGPLIDGLNDLFGSLTNIAAIGSEFLPGFGDSFSNVMQEFREFTESESGQNKIREFMRDSIEALKDILDLFGAIGRVVGGLFSTSDATGQSMVSGLTSELNKFADWLNSPDGQVRMSEFWESAKDAATLMLTLIKDATVFADKVLRIVGTDAPGSSRSAGDRVNAAGDLLLPNKAAPNAGSPFLGATDENGVYQRDPVGKAWDGLDRLGDFFGGDAWSFLNPAEGESPFQAAMRNASVSMDGLRIMAGNLAQGFTQDLGATASGAWQSLQDKVSAVTTTIGGLIDVGKAKVSDLKDRVGEWLGNIGGFWSNLGTSISTVVTTLTDVVFTKLTGALDSVKTFFGTVVDGIGKKWDELKDLAARPINWIIDTVINGTLKNAWNAVAGLLGLPEWNGVARIETPQGNMGRETRAPEPIRRASGGPVFGAGGPTDDKIPAMLSNGEYVLRASAVKKIGVDNLNRLNTNPVQARGKVLGEGMFAGVRMAVGGSVDEAVERAKRFMAGEHGKPYQYGGVGDPSWDCSGLWSGIVNVINGRPATSGRLFNTESDFESMGWTPGLGGRVTIGISRGGGGPNSHMGGTIDGTNAESSGGNGVQWGGAARGSDTFPLAFTLQELAGQFVSGGPGSGGGGGILASIRQRLANQVASLFEAPLNALGSQIPDFGPSAVGQLPRQMYDKIKNAAVEYVRSKIAGASGGGSADAGTTPFNIGAGAEQWRPNVIEALKREGFPVTDGNINLTLSQIQSESSGNPNAVQQVQDVNSGGNEAVGLLQVIPGTFATHRNPDLPNDRTNPDASISAALRYYRARYGADLSQMWGQGHGYDSGGIFPNGTIGWNTSGKPEAVLTNTQWQLFDGFNKNLAHFAQGGYVDPNEYARKRFAQYGEQVGGIVKSAIPEILGISGTPLDPASNRYVQAAMDLQKAFASTAPSANPSYGSATPPSSNTVVDQARGVVEQHTHFHVSSIDEAFRKHQLEQQKAAMAFGGR
ncbi:transglycosylase SLT domain-containing protein [Rhodococcoides corynebacterioides]|uniref:Transglycosylase SLT domain-containing protein n=1 Tax=Rhodococcoides corynebacterioides TaxID=53972 RepID=A0ABS7P3T7_9NOCA|nr:transglycosylase SLT domain-containing protein [Rhodococcus corynebacterioides]MBY6367083.1 transglycosylase SLT domain-containing protein [Rhodococcus corynebacterioides]MBY6407344.1 transglycosylase SLT domain-containing protein [Rhodococcus corynebacterioides]